MSHESLRAELVIFDLDGTLVDTLTDIAGALNRVLSRHSIPPRALDTVRESVGYGIRALLERAVPEHDELWPTLIDEFRSDYAEHLVVDSVPYPGISELLAKLGERGVPTAVLSNKPQALTSQVVAALFAEHPFVAIVGQRPEIPAKPAPDAALRIAAAAGVGASRSMLVGDTQVDIDTARAAGMRAVGVNWGFRARHELAESGAWRLLDHPGELLQILGGERTTP